MGAPDPPTDPARSRCPGSIRPRSDADRTDGHPPESAAVPGTAPLPAAPTPAPPGDPPGGRLAHEGPLPDSRGGGGAAGALTSGASGSVDSGPGVRLWLRIGDDGRISGAAFETIAFDAARSVASQLCAAIVGQPLARAARLSVVDLASMTARAPNDPAVRTVLFAKSAALLPVLGRGARHGPGVTCTCFDVATDAIRRAVRIDGLRTVEQVARATRATTGCGTCRPDVERLLRECAAEPGDASA